MNAIRRLKPLRFHTAPPVTEAPPLDDLTLRVAHRICAAVYNKPCDCAQRRLNQVCDVMRNAAQHAFAEITRK